MTAPGTRLSAPPQSGGSQPGAVPHTEVDAVEAARVDVVRQTHVENIEQDDGTVITVDGDRVSLDPPGWNNDTVIRRQG